LGFLTIKENFLQYIIQIIILMLYILDLKLKTNLAFYLKSLIKFAKHKISVQRLIQIPNNKNKTASIVIITHKSLEKNYQKCIKSFKSNLNIIKNPVLLRLF